MNEQFDDSIESWDEIEKFVLGEMSDAEANAFQNKLNTNPSLHKATEEARLAILGIEESGLQEKLDTFHTNLKSGQASVSKEAVVKMKRFPRWSIAASIVLLAGIAAWLVLGNKSSTEKTYAWYFKPDPGLVTAMGAASDYSFERGMIDYKTGEYKKAIDQWQALLSENKNNDTLQYFIACALMGNGEQEKAIPLFENVITKKSVFYNDANWYLALAWLKKGDKEKAIQFAEKSDHAKKDELIKKLKQ